MHANRVFTIVSLVPRVSSRILLLRRRTGQRSGAKNVVVRMGEGGKGKKGIKKKNMDGFQGFSNRFKLKLPCILFEKRDLFLRSLKFFCSFAESKSKIKLEIFLSSRFEKRIFKNIQNYIARFNTSRIFAIAI